MESNVRLASNVHGPGDAEEIMLVEKLALEDKGLKAEVAKLGLPEGTALICDPWIYGKTARSLQSVLDLRFARV